MARRKISKSKRKRQQPPGPKPSITLEVVQRVAERYGMGVPLVEALAVEENAKINLETWKKALQSHPEFSPHWEAARGKFLAESMRRLVESGELENLRWLLPRRYPELFAAPAAVSVSVSNNNTVSVAAQELSDEELQSIAQRGRGGAAGAEKNPA